MSSAGGADPALETLLLPFDGGILQWPGNACFLRARAGATLRPAAFPGLKCVQTFKPTADALAQAGFHFQTESHGCFPLVLMLPPRQREEARALFARAVGMLEPGGIVVASAGNNEGARSHQADLEKLVGPVTSLSKHKCRVFWSAPHAAIDETLRTKWLAQDATQPIANTEFMSRPGVFAWNRIDIASALLANHLPAGLTGRAADLGAGLGYLSVELLRRAPGITALDVYEAELRALELARINLASARVPVEFSWHDVAAGLPHRYDVIVTNPPFHTQGSAERPDVGRRFIEVAARSLALQGRLWLVANRHLPYEATLDKSFGSVRIVAQAQGFKIIEAIRTER